MEANAYIEFRDLEGSHWWFAGRLAIFRHLLQHRIFPTLTSSKSLLYDLGCCMGAALGILSEAGTAVGTDIAITPLRHCRSRGFSKVLVADGTHMPFKNRSFDVITAFDTIEHIRDDYNVAIECYRILKKGGWLFISVPAYQFLYAQQDKVVQHQRRYTISGLHAIFQRAGFKIEQASYINFFLFPIILPAVLIIKLKEKIFPPGDRKQTSNVSIPIPKWTNWLCAKIFSFERHILLRFSVPFGHSLILIARKP